MGFMLSYKRLEKLCNECYNSDKGVSIYIEKMEMCYNSRYKCIGWEDIYNDLKYYRHIRNEISHNPDFEEEDLCTNADIAWLDDYYNKIMNQTDALAIYRQRETIEKNQRIIHKTEEKLSQEKQSKLEVQRPKKKILSRLIDRIKELFR